MASIFPYQNRKIFRVFVFNLLCLIITFSSYSQSADTSVKLLPKIDLTIVGYKTLEIPDSVVKNSNFFQVDSPYKIKKLFVYVSDPKNISEPMPFALNSGKFDKNFIAGLKKYSPPYLIAISPIFVTDPSGREYELNGRNYIVTK